MAKNITAGSAVTFPNSEGVFIQVNAALTGNIVVAAGSTTVATIQNPTVGSEYKYGGLTGQGSIVVTPSTTCDITVTLLNKIT